MRNASGMALTVAWLALLALAAASFALSSLSLGAAAAPVALAIAAVKAAVIALVFMELVAARYTHRAVLAVAVGFVALLVGLVLFDVRTRTPPPFTAPPARAVLGR